MKTPWKAKPVEGTTGMWQVVSADDQLVAMVPNHTDDETAEERAKLLAASPELLKGLRGMLEWARRVKEKNPGMEIAEAGAAITKADKGS